MSDLIARAEAALEGVTEGPWIQVGYGNIHRYPVREDRYPPIGKVYGIPTGNFIAWARTGVPELIAELKAARQESERLGWFLDRLGFPSPERDTEIERRLRE